jgi:excinuclease ABC subunit A
MFTGARNYVLKTFATTQSALMKKRVSRFMVGNLCPVRAGKRLKLQAPAVRFAGYDIGELSQMPLSDLAQVLAPVAAGKMPGQGGPKGNTLSRAASRKASAERVKRGASPHAAAPDVRVHPLCPKKKYGRHSGWRRTCWRACPH